MRTFVPGMRGETFTSGSLNFSLNGQSLGSTPVNGLGVYSTQAPVNLEPGSHTLSVTLVPSDAWYATETQTATVTVAFPAVRQ
jgi:hypothetical protein